MKITVYGNEKKILYYDAPVPVKQVMQDCGEPFSMPCGGNHTCGKCRIRVKGRLSEMSDAEKKLLGDFGDGLRLACFAVLSGDGEIFLEGARAEAAADGFRSELPLDPIGESCGIAVDVGTTTVVVYLYDLKNGRPIAREAFANPQGVFGGDVISRIEAALSGHGEELKGLILSGIARAAETACQKSGIPIELCKTAVITGNTTMLYLLLGKDVSCLSRAPFEIDDFLGRFFGEIELSKRLKPRLYLPSTVSAFVGSDITCAMLAVSDIVKSKRISMLVDIGTNGEMALLRDGAIYCCSAAAGPALEGAGIKMGCMAQNGAVNRVWADNGSLRYASIGDAPPSGICGSGLIDAVAAMLRLGLIDETGRIDRGSGCAAAVTEYDGEPAVKIGDSGVVVTQRDIRAVQLAKAAIRAGMEALLDACKITASQVEQLILAGGFGSLLNVESAAAIGLIPKELAQRSVAVGNAAGMGAVSVLLSRRAMEQSRSSAKRCVPLDLSASPFFMERYVESMTFSGA